MPDASVEFRLLLACARAKLAEEARPGVRELASRTDWDVFLQLARHHWVLNLVNRTLKAECADLVPASVAENMRRTSRNTAAFNLGLLNELGRLTGLLTDGGVRSITFKGPLLAQKVYGNIGLRPSTDLDLLIPPGSYEGAQAALAAGGYVPNVRAADIRRPRQQVLLYLKRQATFVRGRAYAVDLHVSLMPPGYRYESDFESLYLRTQSVQVGDVTVRTFAPEDLLLLLCFHGVKNRWELLKYSCDVAELLRSQPGLLWEVVLDRARANRAERILRLGIYLAHSLLEAPVPEQILAWAGGDATVRALSQELTEALSRDHTHRLDVRERFRFYVAVQDSIAGKLRYCTYAMARQLNEKVLGVSLD